ncbi:MAG: galactose-1-phosphate uridylyltransferase [Candidatus Doudnabacteria bacterium]|nr:galactose-1-phosphate uridylyltransferase [Candidatus Doudnabacteria bacterium]
MSEFRQDIVSQHWVLFAPNRSKRPEDFGQEAATPDPGSIPACDHKCVFCPGNEGYNLEILSYPPGSEWKVRVIPNKYEALGHSGGRKRNDFYNVREGIGDHEVIITRPHNVLTGFLSDSVMDANLYVYQQRMRDLSNHPEVQYIHILQNHGKAGGASMLHPHSQIFATPFVPEHLHDEVVGSHDYFHQNGACVYCEMILKEMYDRERIVIDHEEFLVFCPFAARVPYALRVIPKRHMASFMDVTDSERMSLAKVLKEALQKIYHKLGNPAYNYYIHSLPVSHELVTRYDSRSYHWHLEILPRLNVWGGFELGSDVYVNTIMPETAADLLRQPGEPELKLKKK